MEKREPRIYYYAEKELLIFDAGHADGDIHIYEYKQTLPATELKALLQKLGHNISWRLEAP